MGFGAHFCEKKVVRFCITFVHLNHTASKFSIFFNYSPKSIISKLIWQQIMDVGTVLSFGETILNALQCSELKEIFSILGYQSELESLERTVKTIKAVLLDAKSKLSQAKLSHLVRAKKNGYHSRRSD